jgi:ferric-dicitrate binding protein FerR (iron transport regulator)
MMKIDKRTDRLYSAWNARFALCIFACCVVAHAAYAGEVLQSVAMVERILPAGQGAVLQATLLRGGNSVALTANVALQTGDEIETDANTRVLIRFTSEPVQVALGAGTRARIGSLFLVRGQAMIRKLKGYFGVETEFGTAASESTEYLVSVSPAKELSVVVVEGTVKLTPKVADGPPLEPTIVMPNEEAVVTQERSTMRGPSHGRLTARVTMRTVSSQKLEAIRGLLSE